MFNFNTQSKKYSLNGEITVPGDKSIAHRAIMFGSLAKGVTQLSNFSFSEDLATTARVFKELGAKIHSEPSTKSMIIKGTNHQFKKLDTPLEIHNVGELESLLLGVLASVPEEYIIDGGDFLKKRPQKNTLRLLSEMGAKYVPVSEEALPLKITGSEDLNGITYQQEISSAQIKSSLILAGLYAKSKTKIIRKIPTRNHTEVLANYFGAGIDMNDKIITIDPKMTHLKGQSLNIPGDFSSASFYLVGAMLSKDSKITLRRVGLNPTRIGLLDVIKQMGGQIEISNRVDNIEPYGDLTVWNQSLHGTTITAEKVPSIIDEIPLIALIASQATGKTVIEEVQDVYLQNSERVRIMRTELAKLGIVMQINDDSIVIEGNQQVKVKDDVDSHKDHRIAMMLVIASNLTKTPFQIKNIEAIDVSYPNFISDLKKLVNF
ncbi:3-phosphoshikimate 1-carboxyvinyltransferase [Companilactobacillus tucceti DSM 20183]|uniref:3-phosphoshikimate 1-carboxyvinyltransferase n=1 Tax=Companilactobacillus tucceti DSM 20183 TaxID=1423811 RepID=A0A0R1J9F0_9LACO|nr:3-phosphoshikimate 1-carboxyvinyltransferase [Companilactobacillus tucceti]KRK65449.1 3-phosphoshikimate 1-carboxyvinyltransferase [Companilactobacillus tucceti DSM 20183]